MKVCAIDIGTNSFLCLIAEISNHQIEVLYEDCIIVRLGEGIVKTGKIGEPALERAKSALSIFSGKIKEFNVVKIQGVGTSSARSVSNFDMIVKMGSQLGIPIHEISGEEEARLSYQGAIGSGPENSAILDVGGGSTEIMFLEENKINSSSFEIGAVKLFEEVEKNFDAKDFCNEAMNVANKSIDLNKFSKVKDLVCVGGTATTIACLIKNTGFDPKIEGSIFNKKELRELITNLLRIELDERLKLVGMVKGREDVLPYGAILIYTVLEKLKLNQFVVSTRGLRYGLAVEIAE